MIEANGCIGFSDPKRVNEILQHNYLELLEKGLRTSFSDIDGLVAITLKLKKYGCYYGHVLEINVSILKLAENIEAEEDYEYDEGEDWVEKNIKYTYEVNYDKLHLLETLGMLVYNFPYVLEQGDVIENNEGERLPTLFDDVLSPGGRNQYVISEKDPAEVFNLKSLLVASIATINREILHNLEILKEVKIHYN
jgi:hypothetical protein